MSEGNGFIKTFLGDMTHKDKLTLITSVGSFIVVVILLFVQSGERKDTWKINENQSKNFLEELRMERESRERVSNNFSSAILKITLGIDSKDNSLYNKGIKELQLGSFEGEPAEETAKKIGSPIPKASAKVISSSTQKKIDKLQEIQIQDDR